MRRVDKPAPITVTVEFTETEAEILCALVGGVVTSFFDASPAAATANALFEILNAATPNRKVTFSDHFDGDVRVKR